MDVRMTAAELQGPPVGICAKTGGRCDTTKPLVVRYTPPWVYLFIVLLGIGLVFILVALALSTKVRIPLPLSRSANREVARRRLVGAGVLVGGTVVSFVIAAQVNPWVGLTGVFASFVYGLYQVCLPVIRAKMSADGTVLLKGVSPVWVHAMRTRPMYGGYAPMAYAHPGMPTSPMPSYSPYAPAQVPVGYPQAAGSIAAGMYENSPQFGFYSAPPQGMPPYAAPPQYGVAPYAVSPHAPDQPPQPLAPPSNGWTVTPP